MNQRIFALIVEWYAFPWRTAERDHARQLGERKGRWHG